RSPRRRTSRTGPARADGAALRRRIKHYGHARRVAVAFSGWLERQQAVCCLVDAVAPIRKRAPSFLHVWVLRREDEVVQGVVEEELRRELVACLALRVGPNLEVDVHGPPLVPTRINRGELDVSVLVGHLVATQELPTDAATPHKVVPHVRVHARRVTVPDVYLGALERSAGAVTGQ